MFRRPGSRVSRPRSKKTAKPQLPALGKLVMTLHKFPTAPGVTAKVYASAGRTTVKLIGNSREVRHALLRQLLQWMKQSGK